MIRYPLAARPWQYVLEPLNGYLTLAEHLWEKPDEFSGGWNFGPDQNSVKTVKDTVELAGKSWGNAAEYDIAEGIHLHEAHLLQLSSKKAQTKLRWNPRLNFEEAINITIQWYKQYYSSNENLLEYTLQQITQYEGSVTHA